MREKKKGQKKRERGGREKMGSRGWERDCQRGRGCLKAEERMGVRKSEGYAVKEREGETSGRR